MANNPRNPMFWSREEESADSYNAYVDVEYAEEAGEPGPTQTSNDGFADDTDSRILEDTGHPSPAEVFPSHRDKEVAEEE